MSTACTAIKPPPIEACQYDAIATVSLRTFLVGNACRFV